MINTPPAQGAHPLQRISTGLLTKKEFLECWINMCFWAVMVDVMVVVGHVVV